MRGRWRVASAHPRSSGTDDPTVGLALWASKRNDWPGVIKLLPGEIANLIRNFSLRRAARKNSLSRGVRRTRCLCCLERFKQGKSKDTSSACTAFVF